jgi:hypothetical protein
MALTDARFGNKTEIYEFDSEQVAGFALRVDFSVNVEVADVRIDDTPW